MGYNAEKKAAEHRWKLAKRIALFVMLALLIALCTLSAFCPADTWKYHFDLPNVGKRAAGDMRIHFIDVGQGDATLIELPDGKTMLIDGGTERTTSVNALMRYLNALKIDRIDYLVITHADADHCGGLDTVIKNKQVIRAFVPVESPTNNKEYVETYAALRQKGVATELSSRSVRIETGGKYTLTFLYPYTLLQGASMENEHSAVVWLDYNGVSALFTGDAPKEVEEKLMADDKLGAFELRNVALSSTEILKVSHHGSNDGTSQAFLTYLGVKTSVISCGAGNPYGHPTAEVLGRLSNTDVYRTDTHGSVVVTVKSTGEYSVRTLGK